MWITLLLYYEAVAEWLGTPMRRVMILLIIWLLLNWHHALAMYARILLAFFCQRGFMAYEMGESPELGFAASRGRCVGLVVRKVAVYSIDSAPINGPDSRCTAS